MKPAQWIGFLCLILALSPNLDAQEPAVSLKSGQAKHTSKEPDNARSDVIFCVGGIGGWDTLHHSARLAFPMAGLHHEIRDFVWTHGWGKLFKDLQDFRHVEKKAEELAQEIMRVRQSEPDRRVYLIAKSGGTGLALRAAELLPPETLERMVLIAAAVTPQYDLRPALRAVRGEIVSYYSPYDQFILNWGTRNFGTIDRYYGPSAGLHGFIRPTELTDADREMYQRLVQISWTPRMIWEGYVGGHVATSFPAFLVAEVGPWLK